MCPLFRCSSTVRSVLCAGLFMAAVSMTASAAPQGGPPAVGFGLMQAMDAFEGVTAWSTGGREAVYDPAGLWTTLGDPGPTGRLDRLSRHLRFADGVVQPLRTGKEVALYNAIKQFAATQPGSARIDIRRVFEMALTASADASGRANISVALLTAHNVMRVLARPGQWTDAAQPGEYGHPPSDPMQPIFADLTSLTAGTLPAIMKTRVAVPTTGGTTCDGRWTVGLFAREGGLFQIMAGARDAERNAAAHCYFWAGAVGQDQLAWMAPPRAFPEDLASDALVVAASGAEHEIDPEALQAENRRALVDALRTGQAVTARVVSRPPSPGPLTPLKITAMTGASTSINNAPKTDSRVYWTGTAVPPLTVVTAPAECPPGGCATMTFNFPTLASPLVLNDAEWCWGYRESFRVRYRTVLSDSAGHVSPPFFTEGECIVPKAPDPVPASVPPGSSGSPGVSFLTGAPAFATAGATPTSTSAQPAVTAAATSPSLSYTVSHYAGSSGGPGVVAGTGWTARFFAPAGVAANGKGTIVVADAGTSAIRKVTADGVVSALVGQPGVAGSADGGGDFAQFDAPLGVAIAADGVVWVADTGNHTIRRINTANISSTFAGAAGQPGSTDATGAGARFRRPAGLALGPSGIVYVADTGNHAIRKITSAGVVTTLAGKAGEAGSADGAGSAARFSSPTGLATDSVGNLYVADTHNHLVRKITPAGVVTTIAGQAGVPGRADGVGAAAALSWPMGVAVDASGFVYVTDTYNHTLRRVSPTGTVVTLAGKAGQPGVNDSLADTARFSLPIGVAADASGVVYVADSENHALRAVTATGAVTTVAGSAPEQGWLDGLAAHALFASPTGIGYDSQGNLFVADTENHVIRKMRSGVVTTFAGAAGEVGSADGTGAAARFNRPTGLLVDGDGSLWVADSLNHTIRRITPEGIVSTVAGSAGVAGTSNGTGAAARFDEPRGLAMDASGTLYVADAGNHAIRKVSRNGTVTTLAGMAGQSGAVDSSGTAARFAFPYAVAVDTDGNVFVADTGNATMRRITPAGVVSTFAGVAGERGTGDIMTATARFQSPRALAFDADGYLWVADGNTIRRFSADGTTILTLAGLPTVSGTDDGVGTAARFDGIGGLALYKTYVLVADTGNSCLRLAYLGDAVSPLVTAIAPAAGAIGGGTRVTISGVNFTTSGLTVKIGGKPLTDVQVLNNWVLTGVVPAGTTGAKDLEVFTFAGRAYWWHAYTYTPYTSYLAEGATIAPFTTELALLNPGDTKATGTVRFARPDGTTTDWGLEVPPHTRVTWWPGEKAGAGNAEFSTSVESDQPLVVDRTMTWDAGGYGSHAETGVATPALTWYLAEGATHSGFDLFYLIQNPNANDANVEVSFLLPSGAPLVRNYQVRPKSRFNIWVDAIQELGSTDVSAVIRSTNQQPVIVERAMYLTGQGRLFNAGHESAGVTRPALTWYLAEGATGPYFDLFILIANPADREADIEAQYLLPDGTTLTKRYRVGPKSRFNIWADVEEIPAGSGQYPLADTAVSTRIASLNGVEVVVERAMWWPGDASRWHEAHNSPGATQLGTRWALAAGEVSTDARGLETFILLANASSRVGDIVVTLMFEDETTAVRRYTVPASSRTNVWVNTDFPEAAGRRFGAVIESVVPEGATSPAEIVVERAMYSSAGGVGWAAGTNALATRLP